MAATLSRPNDLRVRWGPGWGRRQAGVQVGRLFSGVPASNSPVTDLRPRAQTRRRIPDALSVHQGARTFPSRGPASRRYRRRRPAAVHGRRDITNRSVHVPCGPWKRPPIHCNAGHRPRHLRRRPPAAATAASIVRATPLRLGHRSARSGSTAPGGPIVPGNLPGTRNLERRATGYCISVVPVLGQRISSRTEACSA